MSDLISIITPVYNGEAFVAQAIESVLAQSHTHWELWIINDGSTDGTEEIIKQYLKDDRIHYLKQENAGVSAARNKGLQQITGDWFITLDADDYLPPKSLSSRVELAAANPELDFIDGHVIAFSGADPLKGEAWKPSFSGPPQATLIHETQRAFVGTTWMVRRPKNLKYFPEGMTHAEDLYFYIINSGNGQYGHVNEPIYCFRRGETSAMSNLAGLEAGYLELITRLDNDLLIPGAEKGRLVQRLRRIMYRSWLKAGKPLAALKSRKKFDQI